MTASPLLRRVALARVAIALVAIVVVFAAVPTISAAPVPLRQADWAAVLAADPRVRFDGIAPSLPQFGPVVAVQWGDDELSGHADVEGVLYVDLNQDGAEEAVLPIYSGGSAGTTGFLVYREAEPRPALVAAVPGTKLYFEVEDGALIVNEAGFVGFEPGCCASARVFTTYAIRDDRLEAVAERVSPNPVQDLTVSAFYGALNNRAFDEAYAFLSPAFRAANPFERWAAGYATTESVTVEYAERGPTKDEVTVRFRAVDRTATDGRVTRRFAGTWSLIWSPDERRWLLDRASIAETG